jgi:hypothetical protein
VHPEDADGSEDLFSAVERLALNDTGLEVHMTGSHGSGDDEQSIASQKANQKPVPQNHFNIVI